MLYLYNLYKSKYAVEVLLPLKYTAMPNIANQENFVIVTDFEFHQTQNS